jgi:hypothetical protein
MSVYTPNSPPTIGKGSQGSSGGGSVAWYVLPCHTSPLSRPVLPVWQGFLTNFQPHPHSAFTGAFVVVAVFWSGKAKRRRENKTGPVTPGKSGPWVPSPRA